MTRLMLTEEMILNEDFPLKGWRRYRIEYGFECSCPEGVVYFPADFDPDIFEEFLDKHLPQNICKCRQSRASADIS